ncbi:MAG: glycosyltransferase, partial [Armatimonadota bacterium]|nr:glycosyltransferase [Armatimonadota bacterium]
MQIDLSVVIVNWNTCSYLHRCLASVESNKIENMEIVVVDNASVDGSPEMVEREFPQVKLIKNNANLGFAKAA